jgi:hypothetical protein
MNNCRFNPTINGFLHVGHVCMCLVNETEALKHGGKLIVRMDNTQQAWIDKLGQDKIASLIANAKYVFERILKPGYITTLQSDYDSKQNHILKKAEEEPVMYFHDRLPKHKGDFNYYPYTARYTAEKVIMDFLDEVNLLVRGYDLITEFALYEYFTEKYGFPKVTHWYLPRLMAGIDDQIIEMSKTKQNGDVTQFLGIYGSWEEMINNLKFAYLKDHKGEWEISNVKEVPVLVIPKKGK